ncbi:MAG: FkbM family methyltransferase [Arenicellales bacterium]
MEIFLNNEYTPILKCIHGTASPSIVDLGANIGGFALFIFENFPEAKVVSVEAAPDTYEILRRNQEINPERNWKILQAAVWAKNGYVNLDRRDASTGHRIAIDEGDGESVPARRLDDILTEAGIVDIDLMKMDIEGAESDVVPVNEEIFKRTKILVIEIHTDRIDPARVYNILAGSFSHCWKVSGRNVQKPVLILAHKDIPISDAVPVNLKNNIDLPSAQRSDD